MKADVPKNHARLNRKQSALLSDKLNQVAKTVDGICVYDKGWDDERVLEALGGDPFSVGQVSYSRRAIMGPLFKRVPGGRKKKAPLAAPSVEPQKPGDYALMRVELEEAHKRIDRLEAFVKFLDPDWRASS